MPDDEKKSPPSPAETARSSAAGEPLILPRRRSAPARDAAAESERVHEIADLHDSVRALSERLDESFGPGAAPAPPKPPESRANRRWKRVARPDQAETAPPVLSLPEPAADALPTPRPRTKLPARRAPARKLVKKGIPLSAMVVAQVFGFSLIGLGYFLGQTEAPAGKAGPAPAAAGKEFKPEAPVSPGTLRGVSERGFQAVNAAMAAAKKGQVAEARETLESAQRRELGIPGSDYRLALLAIQRGDLKEAKLRLDCAMAANQEMAGCCYVRAMLAGAIGDYSRASDECAKAAYAEPFNIRYLFFWAECLRRNGRMQEAIARFEQALTRPASLSDLDYIAFKLRLTQIEAGRSGEFSAELAKQLSAEQVSPYWLMTAAALEMEANDAAAAASHLQKASKLMPALEFDAVVRDFLLVSHSNEPAIAPYYMRGSAPASPSPNVAAITVDPLSWTLQSADPAAWPAAAIAR